VPALANGNGNGHRNGNGPAPDFEAALQAARERR
jgi:hypothetical protein